MAKRMFRGIDLDERRLVLDADTGEIRKRFALGGFEQTRTIQSQKEATDINVIVERFGVTGQLPTRADVTNLGDFDGVFDYQTAMNAVVAADRAFMKVDAKIRKRFDNDPQQYAAFVLDPANEDECRKLGLWNPKSEPVPDPVQRVVIVDGDGKLVSPPSSGSPEA